MDDLTMRGGTVIAANTTTGILALLEPDDSVRDALLTLLHGQGWVVEVATDAKELGKLLQAWDVTAVISEASMPGAAASEILGVCSARHVPVIFTGHDQRVQAAVDLVRQGADDYLDKPFSHQRLLDLLNRLTRAH
ncbi:MAG TPA: response regulator [Xanthomonadales bacterium]|nr:response regulator [Xanthomonadales bacterium]